MQQGVKRAGHAAAGAVQSGEPMKLANGIKRIGCRIKEKNRGGATQQSGCQEDASKQCISCSNLWRHRIHSDDSAVPTQAVRG